MNLTASQWAFAVLIPLALASLLHFAGQRLLKPSGATHAAGSKALRVARFAVSYLFFLYSVLRTMTPTLDEHVSPPVAALGLLALWVLVFSILSRSQGDR